jgi:tetratricopeptide (TPR) repeat protein
MGQQRQGKAYLVLDAALCLAHKDFEAAERRIEAATAKGALRPYALEVLGKSFHAQHRWYDAERAFATLAQEFPQSHVAHFWLAVVYNDLNMFGQAVREVRLATEIQPNHIPARILLGSILFRAGRYHEASKQYQQALNLAASEASLNVAATISWTTFLVRCLLQVGQFEAAIEAIASVPDPSVELQVLRAECLLGLGQLAEAERDCRKILEHDENQLAAVITLVKTGMQQTVTPEHAQLLEAELAKNSNNSEVTYLLAQVHGKLGNQPRRQELILHSQRLQKLQVRSIELLDDVWWQPDNVDARLELAGIFDELGDSVQAKQWRQAADGCQQRIKAIQATTP